MEDHEVRASALALLEERPYSQSELSSLIGSCRSLLQELASEGIVLKIAGRWQLAPDPAERQAADRSIPPAGHAQPGPGESVCTKCTRLFVPRSRRQAWCVGCRSSLPTRGWPCQDRCGRQVPGRGMRCADCRRLYEHRLLQTGPTSETVHTTGLGELPPDVRTVVADGVEYEAMSVGRHSLSGDMPGMHSPLVNLV